MLALKIVNRRNRELRVRVIVVTGAAHRIRK